MMDLYARGVYFFSDSPTFSYAATCLADGLDQIGVPVLANISYGDPLITDFCFEKCMEPDWRDKAYCVVVDLQDTRQYYHQVVKFEAPHERTIVLCMQDDAGAFCIDGVAALLCAHENSFRKIEGIRVPIGFGLSSAMIRKSLDLTPETPRIDGFLHSFRPSLNQHLRACLDLVLLPALSQQIPVHHRLTSAGRWNDDYYTLLRQHLGCLAYGGTFEQDFSKNEYFMQNEQFRMFMSCVDQKRETVVLRWDSWRFWESLIFGCVTVHLNFEEYGFVLPEMPENWKHYIGINLADVRSDVERLQDERKRLPEIAWNGRQWVIEHYSPIAAGRRFLALMRRLSC